MSLPLRVFRLIFLLSINNVFHGRLPFLPYARYERGNLHVRNQYASMLALTKEARNHITRLSICGSVLTIILLTRDDLSKNYNLVI